jgi:hypothetical protein
MLGRKKLGGLFALWFMAILLSLRAIELKLPHDCLRLNIVAASLDRKAKEDSMRTVAIAIGALLGLTTALPAATFTCEFIGGNTTPKICPPIESTKVNGCDQDYSPSLFGRCKGRSYQDDNILVCLFAARDSMPSLDQHIDNMNNSNDTVLTAISKQPGVHALATEWVTPSAATNLELTYTDEQGSLYAVKCVVVPQK